MKKEKPEIITWKLEVKSDRYGFFIPDERSYYGGDFFVNPKNFGGAVDRNRVRAETLINTKGKKPEVKIIEVLTGKPKTPERKVLKTVEGVYTWGDENFWFVDVEGQEKGYFVYGKKKNGAKDGDSVRADIVEYNGKEEGIVVEILSGETTLLTWKYSDNDKFGFVLPDDKSGDIFIAGSRKADAENGDTVTVKIIKQWGRRREGVIVEVL